MRARTQGTGFTLIELLIVIAIISIIAAFAYPSYIESVRKGKRAGATRALTEVAQRLERCYTQYNSYTNDGCTVYSTYKDGANYPETEYTVDINPANGGYTLVATAQADSSQAKDENCQQFELTDKGEKTVTKGAKKDQGDYCWPSST